MSQHTRPQLPVATAHAQSPTESTESHSMQAILSDPYRRAILYSLQRSSGPQAVVELTDIVLTWCPDGITAAEAYGTAPQIWLRDCHLGPMEAAGIVRYDRPADEVTLPEEIAVSVTPPWADK